MSAKIRIDVEGNGNEFSQLVEVDTDQVVSSIKVDAANKEIKVYYKRKEGVGEPLSLSEDKTVGMAVEPEVTAPVNEVATPDEPAEGVSALIGVVTPDEAKMDAHQAGDDGTEGTMSASGTANVDGPNVVISGGTPTVDGKKPTTRGRRATNK